MVESMVNNEQSGRISVDFWVMSDRLPTRGLLTGSRDRSDKQRSFET